MLLYLALATFQQAYIYVCVCVCMHVCVYGVCVWCMCVRAMFQLGDHKSLKKKRGLYWELIKQQELEEELDSS